MEEANASGFRTLEEVRVVHMRRACERTNWDLPKAAELLEIDPGTLRRYLPDLLEGVQITPTRVRFLGFDPCT